MSHGRFAYDPGGRVFAIACGSELLVHDGDTEGPLWRHDLGEELAGVDLSGDEIVALLRSGSIVRYAIKDGRELGRTALPRPAHALACGAGGWIAAAHEVGVSLIRRGDFAVTTLDHDGVTALGFSGDATKLLLGTQEGSLVELTRPERGGDARTSRAEASISAIAWSAKGAWLVAAGDRVLRLQPGAETPAHVTRAGGQSITDVAVSLDGRRFAMQIGDQLVAVLDDPPSDTVAQLRYPERRACGIRFGPGTWLGVGLDSGDANKLDYVGGGVHRSDTHPGRDHHSWHVAVSLPALDAKREHEHEPRPAARPAAKPAPVAYDDPPPADDGPSPMLVIRIVIAVIFFLLALVRMMDR